MCGLLGFIGAIPPESEKLRLLMLYNALERGKDSTGIYTPSGGVQKTIQSPIHFLKYNDLITLDNLFIGHVRSATIGTVKKDNAHPFQYGKTVLVHNGTLRHVYPFLEKIGKSYSDFNVDSEILCYAIERYGEKLDFLTEIDGAIAIVWTNTDRPNELKCFRNYERPLYYGFIEKNVYLSSIEDSLDIIGCEKVKEIDTNTIYTFNSEGVITKQKLKVKNTYVHVYNNDMVFSNANKDAISLYTLRNHWLQICSDQYHYQKKVFTKGKWYLCTDVDYQSGYRITLLGDDDCLYGNSKHNIDYEHFKINRNDYVMCMSTVTFKKTKKVFAETGDIIKCTIIYTDGDITGTNIRTNESAIVPINCIRKATKEEVEKYLNKANKNCKVKNKSKEMKSYINGILDRINEHVENIREKAMRGNLISGELEELEKYIQEVYFEEEEEVNATT